MAQYPEARPAPRGRDAGVGLRLRPRFRGGQGASFQPDPSFLSVHLWLPLAAFAAVLALATTGRADLWLADLIYDWGGGAWSLRDGFLTEHVLHRAGRDLSAAAWLLALAAWALACARQGLRHLRMPLAYLLVATLLSTLLVAWIKSWSNVDCPWDLMRYGGSRPYLGLLDQRSPGTGRGACFPAGHASGGYAWMASYFFLSAVRPRWRRLGLAAGIGLGLLFGVGQQLRGAHFLSHDLWTAAICWATAALLSLVFRVRLERGDAGAAPAMAPGLPGRTA